MVSKAQGLGLQTLELLACPAQSTLSKCRPLMNKPTPLNGDYNKDPRNTFPAEGFSAQDFGV